MTAHDFGDNIDAFLWIVRGHRPRIQAEFTVSKIPDPQCFCRCLINERPEALQEQGRVRVPALTEEIAYETVRGQPSNPLLQYLPNFGRGSPDRGRFHTRSSGSEPSGT